MVENPFPAYSGTGSYVFICYAHDDADLVFPEITKLHNSGFHIWYDQGIRPGGEWSDSLAKAIKDCSLFLYYVSPRAVASEHCRREVNFALDQSRATLSVHLEETDIPDGLNLSLGNRQAILRYKLARQDYQAKLISVVEQATVTDADRKTDNLIEPISKVAAAPSQRRFLVTFVTAILLGIAAITWYLLPRESPDTVTGEAMAPIRSLVVLPLKNLSGDPDQEYIADGMTEELIGELAKLGSLRVISRTSSMRYKETTKSMIEIAAELDIHGALEGTVTREQDHFRITIQLIDARTDTHLWADQFDREASSVLALRSDLARAVAEQIRLELTPEEDAALRSPRRINPLAYDAYLRAVQLRGPWTQAMTWAPQAIEHLERAVKLDPDFAEAWVDLGAARFWTGQTEKAREAAERALELDARLGEAHAMLAGLQDFDWDFAGARRIAERAVRFSPNDPVVLEVYSSSLLRHGQLEEALRVSERIPLIAPLDTYSRTGHFIKIFYTRHYERTLVEAEQLRKLIPDYYGETEVAAYWKLGRFREARYVAKRRLKQCGKPCGPGREASERGWAEGGTAGARRAWINAIKDTGLLPAYIIAIWYANLGEAEEAFSWLERAYEKHDPIMFVMSVEPMFDSIRSDPRFDDLLQRIGFPESENPAMLADVGFALALDGCAEKAISNLEKAIQLAPEDSRMPRWHYYLAMAHFAAGRYEQVENWAQQALQHEASSYSRAFSHLLLASSNAQRGRLDKAGESLKRAQRLWADVAIKWDLHPIFMAGDPALRDRYLDGLRTAGLEG